MLPKNRREFISHVSLVVLGALGLTACGETKGSSSGSTSLSSTSNKDCADGANTLYTNPGHAHTTLILGSTEINDARAGTYKLLSGSHDHTFQLSAADFSVLKSLKTIQKTDLEGHGHIIVVGC